MLSPSYYGLTLTDQQEEDMPRTVTVTAEWRSHHTDVEVPDDWDGELMSLPEDTLNEIDSRGAELVDWEIGR